jgi:hypothetical protein
MKFGFGKEHGVEQILVDATKIRLAQYSDMYHLYMMGKLNVC